MLKTQLTDYTTLPLNELPLSRIAQIIQKDWNTTGKSGVYFGAKPYLDAMKSLNSINDNYIADSGRSIVMYFLSNATTWRGETAKAIKAHLNALLRG